MTYTAVPITPGSGADVAVDSVSGLGVVQLIKLDKGAQSASSVVTESNPLPVHLLSVDATGAKLTTKFAVINESTLANNEIVAAVGSKKIRVTSCKLLAGGTLNVTFKTASTALEGAIPLIANAGYVLPYNPEGWFETVAGEALNLDSDAAVQVSGHLTYVEV